jgi:hypothetical protein
MALNQWLSSTHVSAPALSERMRIALDSVDAAGGVVEDRALSAALHLAGEVLRESGGTRTTAISLLAADALMTYAFEAAADAPDRIDALAEAAISRISSAAAGSPE